MNKQKGSIRTKIVLGTLIPIISLTLLFSFVFYFTSMRTVQENVIPEFEKSLNLTMDDLNTRVHSRLINRALQDKNAHNQLLNIVNRAKDKAKVENISIHSKVDGEDVLLVFSDSPDYLVPRPFNADANRALETENKEFSDIYSDEHGVHMTLYYAIPGDGICYRDKPGCERY